MKITVWANCWFVKEDEPNLGMWDDWHKEIEMPCVPRVGENVRCSFDEQPRVRNILIDEVRHTEYNSEIFVTVHGRETDNSRK